MVLFLSSLLIVFKPPTYTFWLGAVIVGEYSVIFIGLTLVLLMTNLWFGTSFIFLANLFGLLALSLFVFPLVRAFLIGQQLPNDLRKAFQSNIQLAQPPFSFVKLFQTVPKIPFRTMTYVTYPDKTLTLDFYSSIRPGKRPCVLVIHGGSWTSGNSRQLSELNSHLACAGYHCAAINYRLAPQWKCPAPIEDATAALKYLHEHAEELNIDAENFVLLGRSAGGQIALLTAYTKEGLGIRGAVNFYGPADMIWGYQTPTNPAVLKSTEVLVNYVGGHYPDMPEKYRLSSPIEFVTKKTVPTLSFHGVPDALVFAEHAHRLARKLEENRVPNFYLELPWGTHGFDYHLNGPGGQLSTYTIEYFLAVVTHR